MTKRLSMVSARVSRKSGGGLKPLPIPRHPGHLRSREHTRPINLFDPTVTAVVRF